MPKPRVLLIGWDAADWKVINPLVECGQMPNLARLMREGVHGNIATIYPALSPMLWTSIATGKRPFKHGIHGFSEPLPDGSGVRPSSLLSRKTKALWNILNQTGHQSLVVGWWPSHPAEPINGVMVSNHFQQPGGTPAAMPPLVPGAVHPASLAASLAELRVNPMEVTGEFLRYFIPQYERVDQALDKRLHGLGKILAETMSIHAVATELLSTQPWDFAAVYYTGIDHFGHGFMKYHPPRLAWVTEKDFELYQHVVANAYRYHDAMLGTLLESVDANTSVIVMSDHGFHPDHLRPAYIPAEPAGPAVEHRHFGILCLKGPDLRAGEGLFGASVLDICPTVLALFGLPPGKDMDGKVLVTAFKDSRPVEPLASWDAVPGDAGLHPPDACMDPVASAEAFKQLVELGYVAPPGANARETVDECVRELKYNLARAYWDANRCREAAALAEELWERWPREHRFGLLFLECLGRLEEVARRHEAIEELGRRIERYQAEAAAELLRRADKVSDKVSENEGGPNPLSETLSDSPTNQAPHEAEAAPKQADRAEFELRLLRELAHGRPGLLEWLRLSQALLENRPADARRCLEALSNRGNAEPTASALPDPKIAVALLQLGELDSARALLERALELDPENALVHGHLARLHFTTGKFDEALAAATRSLSLLYFQPGLHALLGQSLLELGKYEQAEQALQVAVAQSPRNLLAHESLGQLYREHLPRPAEAFAHEGRANSLRQELATRRRNRREVTAPLPASAAERDRVSGTAIHADPEPLGKFSSSSSPEPTIHAKLQGPTDAPFPAEVDPGRIITVVSGLPRSGTSMMMQILAAAGRELLTDNHRAADDDNPLGYFEFEKATELARDFSWLEQARGKTIKIVAQLLPALPAGEHYQVLLMQRDLGEVIASQKAMLARQNRQGAALDEAKLIEVYSGQLRRVLARLATRRGIRMLLVNYASLIADPESGINRVAHFLGDPFNREAARAAIHPHLRRQRA
jgi:predicted AlkP superfamily phosphohydrolase/phosphomutase/tetratricopeptide (TPR) repeat protein